MDGLENVLTGMGVMGRDNRLGARYRWLRPSYRHLEIFHDASDIAKKVCDEIPQRATKKWLTHTIPENKGGSKLATELVKEDDRLEVKDKFRKAMSWARIYGGAQILMVVDDGQELEMPLDLEKVNSLQSLIVLHRWEMHRDMRNENIGDPNFGLPEYFSITGRTVKHFPKVHYSRFIRFDGSPLSEEGFRENDYWHDSHLTILRDIARDYDEAYNGVFSALKDFGVNVLKLKELSNLVSSGEDSVLKQRLRLMQMSKSILSAVVIDADAEDFTLLERSFTNIAQTLDKADKRLQMVTGLPHTVLFGEGSTGTLGAGGESEQNTLADLISMVQDDHIKKQFRQYALVVQAQKLGPTRGQLIEGWSFELAPLNEPTEQRKAETRRTTAETDQKYYEMGVLTPAEIADSRFGGDKYSAETQIDKAARDAQKELDKVKIEAKIENPMGVKPGDDGDKDKPGFGKPGEKAGGKPDDKSKPGDKPASKPGKNAKT